MLEHRAEKMPTAAYPTIRIVQKSLLRLLCVR
jgi:hypothetical protein